MDDETQQLAALLQEEGFLRNIVHLAETTPAAPHVVLVVHGTTIKGMLTSMMEWAEQYRTWLQSLQHHATSETEATQQAVLDGLQRLHTFLAPSERAGLRAFLHLKDVTVNGQSVPVLRVRLDQVDAWGFIPPSEPGI